MPAALSLGSMDLTQHVFIGDVFPVMLSIVVLGWIGKVTLEESELGSMVWNFTLLKLICWICYLLVLLTVKAPLMTNKPFEHEAVGCCLWAILLLMHSVLTGWKKSTCP